MQFQPSFLILLIISVTLNGQCPDSIKLPATKTFPVSKLREQTAPSMPGLLSGGLIDFFQSGQVNAAARVYQITIGEKNKLQLPLTLYSGISGSGFSGIKSPKEVVNNLINPSYGIANLYAGELTHDEEQDFRPTGLKIHYLVSGRMLNATNLVGLENYNLFNLLGGIGLTFFTIASERKTLRDGIFWLNSRLLTSINSKESLTKIHLDELSPALFAWSAALGLQIPGAVNGRLTYYRYINQARSALLEKPLIQLSFNYGFQ